MNGLPYYKRFPKDFLDGTVLLPFELKGAYGIVLDLIYMHGGKLPNNSRYISGQLSVSVRKWNSFKLALIEADKIQVTGEFIQNYRAVIELETLSKFQNKQRENRSHPNKINGLQTPKLDHSRDYTDTDTDTKKESKKGICVFSEDFENWWKDEYPDRKGSQGSKPQSKAIYIRNRKAGVTKEQISKATKEYFDELWEAESVGTEFVKLTTTWLNGKFWEND